MTFHKREIKKRITKAEYEKALSNMSFIERVFSDYKRELDWDKAPKELLKRSDWYAADHPEEDYRYVKIIGYEDIIACSEKELDMVYLLKHK